MKNRSVQHRKNIRGFTLLLSVLVTSIVLAVGLAILNLTLKEFLLSNIARESEKAFYAADAGIECVLYWDQSNADGGTFDIGENPSFDCMEDAESGGTVADGVAQNYEFSWGTGTGARCARVRITKSAVADTNVETRVESRGYNVACANTDNGRAVERALRTLY